MLYQKIAKPMNGTRWAIGDIHGCAQTFKTLVNRLALTPQDQLFLLGDYIDRGPDSAGVLDFILELKTNNYQLYCLRGNHEETLVESYWQYIESPDEEYYNFRKEIEDRELNELLDDDFSLKHWHFLSNLYYYFELDDFYLVHTGFDFEAINPFLDKYSMISIRSKNPNLEILNNKQIVFGHTITQLDTIKIAIDKKATLIPLDNGCYYGLYNPPEIYQNQYAHLCAFNLDTWELISQLCVD